MVQMTQDASFGPIIVVVSQPNPPRLFITRIGPK